MPSSWIVIFLLFPLALAENGNTTTAPVTATTGMTPLVPLYYVLNGTDKCLLVQQNIQITIPYFNKAGGPLLQTFYINVSSPVADFSGSCEIGVEKLRLIWFPVENQPEWILEFYYGKSADKSEQNFELQEVKFNYSSSDVLFPDTNDTSSHFLAVNQSLFKCPLGSYWKCSSPASLKLNPDPAVFPPLPVTVTLSDLKVEAFRTSNKSDFLGSIRECSADFVPNKVVPIVVGVALAVMIIIALVTFIVGSRRRQAGYQEI